MINEKAEFIAKALSTIEERVIEYDSALTALKGPTLPERFFDLWRYWISCLSFSSKASEEQAGAYDYYDPYHHQKRAAAGGECFVAAIPMVLFSLWLLYVCLMFPFLWLPLAAYVFFLSWHYYSRDGKLQALAGVIFKVRNERALEKLRQQLSDDKIDLGTSTIVKLHLKGKFISATRNYDDVSALLIFASASEGRPELLLDLVQIDGKSLPDFQSLCEQLRELPLEHDEIDETFTKAMGSLADAAAKEGGSSLVRTVLHVIAFIAMLVIGIGTFAIPIESPKTSQVSVDHVQALSTAPQEGSLVLARYKGSNYGFFGKVARKISDEDIEVHYLDGEKEMVKSNSLFVPNLAKGKNVQFWLERNGKEGWVFAKVQSMTENEVKVVPSDGSVHTIELAKIRVPLD